jgi:hypothetical protein
MSTTCQPYLNDIEQRLLWKIARMFVFGFPPCSPTICGPLSGAGAPTIAPQFIGQLYHDTVADAYYRSTGLTPADWTLISGGACNGMVWGPTPTVAEGIDLTWLMLSGGVDTVTFPTLQSVTVAVSAASVTYGTIAFPALTSIATDLSLQNNSSTAFSAPVLATIGGSVYASSNFLLSTFDLSSLASVGSAFSFTSNAALVVLDMLALTTVTGDLDVSTNNSLTTVNAPLLVTVGGSVITQNSAALTTVNLPLWVPTNGTLILLTGCALSAASVELILRRCVLSGVTTCTIDLSGGTNAGTASLNAQGQADVVTLGAQLTINA